MRGDILAVIGAQFGSEGKGNLVAHVANDYSIHVRVGGPNAGHSFHYLDRVWKMQSIPCGWINPNATLVIGRGALVSVEQLFDEWKEISKIDDTLTGRLIIDKKAGIISPWHHAKAGGVEGEAHRRYGSTGEGVGVARLSRIERFPGDGATGFYHAGTLPMRFVPEEFREAWNLMLMNDTPSIITNQAKLGENVLLEGTQGYGLSLIHGPWPYTTNHDTNAAQLAADCGIPPRHVNRCLLVMRTMPIRVAGNSGPLAGEVSWEEVSAMVGHPVEEKTTVTKKTRRIGAWDDALVREAAAVNGPTSLAINFMDYFDPEVTGITDENQLTEKAWSFIEYVGRILDSRVAMVGVGGEKWNVVKISDMDGEDRL